jgi:hypothetical protein
MEKRLYLRLGDRVVHVDHEEGGPGAGVEEMTSTLEGGTCHERVLFAVGTKRTFHNDKDHEMCCHRFGVRKQWRGRSLEPFGAAETPRGPRRLRLR